MVHADRTSRATDDRCAVRHVLSDDCAGSDDSTGADHHTRKDYRASADESIFADIHLACRNRTGPDMGPIGNLAVMVNLRACVDDDGAADPYARPDDRARKNLTPLTNYASGQNERPLVDQCRQGGAASAQKVRDPAAFSAVATSDRYGRRDRRITPPGKPILHRGLIPQQLCAIERRPVQCAIHDGNDPEPSTDQVAQNACLTGPPPNEKLVWCHRTDLTTLQTRSMSASVRS